MKKLMPLMVLSIVVLFGCAKEETKELAQAIDTTSLSIDKDSDVFATAKKKSRPFKGTIVYTGNENSLDCDCPPEVVGQFAGSGNLTHLGLTTSETDVCNTTPDCGAFPNFGFTVYKQCVIFTAANGDELYASSVGDWSVCGEFPDPFLYGEAVIMFDGGTGKFEDASGEADVEVIVALDENFGTESVTTVFDGEIDY